MSLFPRRRKSLLSRELKYHEKIPGDPREARELPQSRQPAAGGARSPWECGCRHHVPHCSPLPQSHSWKAVDREAPAAAGGVFAGEAEHDPSPGDRGGEPLLAEHALHDRGAGVRPRQRAQGTGFRGHQGGQHFQVSPA